jgi:hypothetical protein
MLGDAKMSISWKNNLFGGFLSLNDNRINSALRPKKLIPARRQPVSTESREQCAYDSLLRNNLFGRTE